MYSGLNVPAQTGTGVLEATCVVPLKMNAPLVNSIEPHIHYLLLFVGVVHLTLTPHFFTCCYNYNK